MSDKPHIKTRTLAPHEWRMYRALRLRALADSPTAFARTLAEEQARPDGYWSGRLASAAESGRDLPLVAEVDGEPVGLSWGRIDVPGSDVANLYQVWVAPGHRRLGVAQRLLDTIITWAREKNARYLELDVTWVADNPAIRLYQRNGFQPVGNLQPLRRGSALREQRMRLQLRSDQD